MLGLKAFGFAWGWVFLGVTSVINESWLPKKGFKDELVVFLQLQPSKNIPFVCGMSFGVQRIQIQSLWNVSFGNLEHNLKGGLVVF